MHAGVLVETGTGVLQNYETAIYLFTQAAEQGHTAAQYNVGVIYEIGKGVPQDQKVALKWYTLAAEQD